MKKLVLFLFATLCTLCLLQPSVAATDPTDGCVSPTHTTAKRAHKNSGNTLTPTDCLLPACHTFGQRTSYHMCVPPLLPGGPPLCSDYTGVILSDTLGNLSACPAWLGTLTWQ